MTESLFLKQRAIFSVRTLYHIIMFTVLYQLDYYESWNLYLRK